MPIAATAIAAFLKIGLIDVGWGLVGSQIADPAVDSGKRKLKDLLKRRRADHQPDPQLQDAVMQALQVAGAPQTEDAWQKWLLRSALDRLQDTTSLGSELRRQVALTLLTLDRAAADQIPEQLYLQLGLRQPGEARDQLAQFLFALRSRLALSSNWGALVTYFDNQALRALAAGSLQEESAQSRYLRQILLHFGVFPDEDEAGAVQRYREYVIRKYNRVSFLLVDQPEGSLYKRKTSAALDAVYVPLRVYDPVALRILDLLRELCAEVMAEAGTVPRSRRELAQVQKELADAAQAGADLVAHVIGQDPVIQAGLQRLAQQKSAAGKLADRLAKSHAVAPARRAESLRDSDRQATMSIDEVLAHHAAFLLRGKPGAGKTTLLKRLAVVFAEGQAEQVVGWQGEALLPIMVPLRNFGKFLAANEKDYVSPAPRALREFIEAFFKDHELQLPPAFVRGWLEQGNCLILLDGLDEVTDRTLRLKVADYVAQFIDHYGRRGNRFGLSARPQGYADARDNLPSDLIVCEVQDLTEPDRDRLVHNVLLQYVDSAAQAEAEARDLVDAIGARDRVDDLSRNPLFCTTLVLVYKFSGAILPSRRVDVYQAVVELMLGFWETHRTQREGVSEAHELARLDGTGRQHATPVDAMAAKRRALLHIADWLAEQNRLEIEAEAVIQRLSDFFREREGAPLGAERAWAEGYLQAVSERSGLFISPDPGLYAFSHKLFLEYLAAAALVGKSDKRLHAAVLAHAGDSWWHEIILLATAMDEKLLSFERREELFGELLAHDLIVLAGACAVDAGDRLPAPAREQVVSRLYTRMTDTALSPAERYAAAEPWDALHGPPDDVNAWVRCPACGDGKQDLYVGKYPVTNAQYALFVAAGGYEEPRWWGGDKSNAWQWRKAGQRNYSSAGTDQPEYWRHARLGKSRRGHPVAGVSWYEAAAYCTWLTDLLARARHEDTGLSEAERALVADLLTAGVQAVRLPSDGEWTRLAGGYQGVRYPWDRPGQPVTNSGNTAAITARANVSEANLRATTPVAMYPAGASHPFELHDLAGNIWEWASGFSLRGGSWYNYANGARVPSRGVSGPSDSNDLIGFRAVSPVVLAAGC